MTCSGCTKRTPATTATSEETTEEAKKEYETFTAAIQSIDELQNIMTFVNVRTDQIYELSYHGGVDVTNKYDEIMAVSQLTTGEIVDVSYDLESSRLISLHVNEAAMRYENVQGMEIDTVYKTVKAAGENLSYTDAVVVFDGSRLIDMSGLTNQDQVSLYVFEGKLCAAVVELGHGYVKLENYDSYIGGMIEIGYDVIVPVTEDMLLTVREGDYQLRITKGSHTGTRLVTVVRDEEITIDLGALQIEPEQTGAAVISVLPKDCSPTVYVDGTKYDADEEIELVYGKHSLRIYADGYETYSGYLEISQAYKKFEYTLTSESETTDESTDETSDTTTENTDEAEQTTSSAGSNTITVSQPVGAKLYVDGNYVGETPCSFTKTAGSHIITLTREGCVTVTYTITAVEDGTDDTYSYDELETFSSALDYLD